MEELNDPPTEGTITSASADPSRVIASLSRDGVSLELKTIDLCFLAGLYLRADKAALASFEEEVLVDLFGQVCDIVEPTAENPRKRATHAIQRLREQRMLARVDGAGVVHAGEYALTRLAAAVVEYFLADEALTRESLTLLTGTLRAQLVAILDAAQKAGDERAWREGVIGPLRVTVGDLVAGIERRQRGLDAQQEEVQSEIAQLLVTDWFHAVDRCQALLDTTTVTLRELNEVLLRDTHHLVESLQGIQSLATVAQYFEAEEVAQRVIEHIDRIADWGGARQHAWSEYYRRVHRYLRDVVRLDPDRALSQRLLDQLAAWPLKPFFLLVAQEPSIRLLRSLELKVERPAVARARVDREANPQWVESEDQIADIEALTKAAVEGGARTLTAVLEQVLAGLPISEHYLAVGRVASVLVKIVQVSSARERRWEIVLDGLEVEEWSLYANKEKF
jgi:chromosome partition protein MukF